MTRVSQRDILERWDTLLGDPLLSFESLKQKAEQGGLETSLRSLCWRFFFGLLPSPSSLSASPSTAATFSTYSLLLTRQRAEYTDLRERYLRAPDGGWIKDGEANGDEARESRNAATSASKNGAGLNREIRPVKVDVTVNNPLGLGEDNPWQSWFADLELRKMIRQDVQRTFPEIEYFRRSSTQNKMTDLLFIYAKLTPDTGYRQGMHELLAPILWTCDLDSLESSSSTDSLPHLVLSQEHIEADTWALFMTLMKSCAPFYDHKATIPLPRNSQAQHRNPTGLGLSAASPPPSSSTTLVQPIVAISTHLHSLLATLDPSLHLAFSRLQIEPQLYAIRWLRLLFSREFPLSETLTLWDGIFARDPSLQITQHIAAAMLLRIRDPLLEAERSGGYGEFLQVLLRYPACPDGTFRTSLLLSQAIHLRDSLSLGGGEAVRKQNEELGIVHPRDNAHADDEGHDLRTAAARGARGQQQRKVVVANGSPSVGVGFLGERGLVGDLAKGVYGRAEALGINKAILGTFNDIRRGVTAAQAQIEEQRQRQRNQFSQIPSRAPWDVDSMPSSTSTSTRDALADLARMRASSAAMSEALDLCVTVLERALSPPTPNPPSTSEFDKPQTVPNGEAKRGASSSESSSLAPQVMAITALKHVRDVLGGQARTFDSSVLGPLQQSLDLLNKSPPLPPLPFDSPALPRRPSSPSAASSAGDVTPPQGSGGETVPLTSALSANHVANLSIEDHSAHAHGDQASQLQTAPLSPPVRSSPAALSPYLGSRSEKPLPNLTRAPHSVQSAVTPGSASSPTPPLKPSQSVVSSAPSLSPSPLMTVYAPSVSSTSSSPKLSATSTKNPPSPSSSSPFDPLGVL